MSDGRALFDCNGRLVDCTGYLPEIEYVPQPTPPLDIPSGQIRFKMYDLSGNEAWRTINYNQYKIDYHKPDLGKQITQEDFYKMNYGDQLDAIRYALTARDEIAVALFKLSKNMDQRHLKVLEKAFTPKKIYQSKDKKTVAVVWGDNSTTVVKLSENDSNDIYAAFSAALAKKIFGSNSHVQKVVQRSLATSEKKKKSNKEENKNV